MKFKRGSVGWMAGKMTASNLKQQADNLEAALDLGEPLSNEEFALVIAYALGYWRIDPFGKMPARISIKDVLMDWLKGKNLPSGEIQRDALKWIVDELREQFSRVGALLE